MPEILAVLKQVPKEPSSVAFYIQYISIKFHIWKHTHVNISYKGFSWLFAPVWVSLHFTYIINIITLYLYIMPNIKSQTLAVTHPLHYPYQVVITQHIVFLFSCVQEVYGVYIICTISTCTGYMEAL